MKAERPLSLIADTRWRCDPKLVGLATTSKLMRVPAGEGGMIRSKMGWLFIAAGLYLVFSFVLWMLKTSHETAV